MHTSTSLQPLGDASVLVSFEFHAGEPRTWNDPGEASEVVILSALVNGEEVDAECFSDRVIQRWSDAIAIEMLSDDRYGDDTDFEAIEDARREWEDAGVVAA